MLVQTKQVCISLKTNLYEKNIPLKGRSRGNSKKGCTCIYKGDMEGGLFIIRPWQTMNQVLMY